MNPMYVNEPYLKEQLTRTLYEHLYKLECPMYTFTSDAVQVNAVSEVLSIRNVHEFLEHIDIHVETTNHLSLIKGTYTLKEIHRDNIVHNIIKKLHYDVSRLSDLTALFLTDLKVTSHISTISKCTTVTAAIGWQILKQIPIKIPRKKYTPITRNIII